MKILLADDDEAIREFVKLVLEHAGHKVDCAKDGFEAWSKITVVEPDLIILDEHMPEMTGLQLCEQLRRSGDTTPIVMLSGSYDTKTLLVAIRSGASDFIVKPVTQDEILARVSTTATKMKFCKGVVAPEYTGTITALRTLYDATAHLSGTIEELDAALEQASNVLNRFGG